jgi:hypothetical protein
MAYAIAVQGSFSLKKDDCLTPWSNKKAIGWKNTAKDQLQRYGGKAARNGLRMATETPVQPEFESWWRPTGILGRWSTFGE